MTSHRLRGNHSTCLNERCASLPGGFKLLSFCFYKPWVKAQKWKNTSVDGNFIGKIHALRKWPWGNAKFWVIFFKPQNQSKGFKHAHAALEHHLNQTKIDIFFSAIFWDKLRGHFRMLKSQNISHALCAHFSWLRTARWDEKSGWWRCPKLDANTLPNSQQPKRKKTQNVSKKQTVSIANFSC